MSTPRPWTVLHSEAGDSEAVVLPSEGTPVVEALLHLIDETYGSPMFSPDNPAVVDAAKSCHVERWHSCTKTWREANGIYGEFCCTSMWAQWPGWHWVLADVRPLDEPVPCKGRQGLWTLPDDVERKVRERLEDTEDVG